jgi:hypothetical protein
MPVLFKAALNDYTMCFCVKPVKMKRLLTSLPVWLILADMVYGFALNVIQSFNLSREPLPKDGLPVSPDIAFSGLQVLANGGMILIIGFGLLVLLQLNRTVLQRCHRRFWIWPAAHRRVAHFGAAGGAGVCGAIAMGMGLIPIQKSKLIPILKK